MEIVSCGWVGEESQCKLWLALKATGFGQSTSPEFVPTTFDYGGFNFMYEGKPINYALHYFARETDLQSPSSCGVFAICFSTTDRDSFESIRTKWLPRIQSQGDPSIVRPSGVPAARMLIAITPSSSSMEQKGNNNTVTKEEVQSLATDIGVADGCCFEIVGLTREELITKSNTSELQAILEASVKAARAVPTRRIRGGNACACL